MKRIITSLAFLAVVLALCTSTARASAPAINGASIETRTFNDCSLSTLTVTNNYPASVTIKDVMNPLCAGFANLHSFSFSADGGASAATFNNNSNFHYAADVNISGGGEGEGGLRLSPWYGHFVDGRIMLNATTGEVACFGGALPFYSFTGNNGVHYVRGTTAHIDVTYLAHDLDGDHPATIEYKLTYNNVTYDSGVLAFGQQNTAECDPHGEWGMLNDGRVGGYFQPRANSGADLQIVWSNITFENLPADGTPCANGAIVTTRTFNDCSLSTVTTTNNYPASISITDAMNPLCAGFANLHSFSFSDDGGATAEDVDNNANLSFSADFNISGAGEGEGGLRLSPWYGQFVDGRFMCNVTTGEIACFGGALPFYSFTVNHGITYTRGTDIHLAIVYRGHDNIETDPATIEYTVVYNGNTYDSGVLPFGKQNAAECDHGLWGNLNDGRAGGYFQPRANTGQSLTATWSNIAYSCCTIEGHLQVKPDKLNLKSHDKWITAYITLDAPLSVADIDPTSLTMNGVPADQTHPPKIEGGAHDQKLKAKFSRADVSATLTAGDQVPVTVRGNIGSECFQATDFIKVKGPKMHGPHLVASAGSNFNVTWEDVDPTEPSVSLLASYDDGATWNLQAANVPNSGSYQWTVPNVSESNVRIALATVYTIDETGYVNSDEVAESDPFAIVTPTGVTDGVAAFSLRGVSPNPAARSFNVLFSLPSNAPATLAVYDIGGRQVDQQSVGGLGAGTHSLSFGQHGNLRAGVYMIRLTQVGGRVATTRVTVIP